MFSVEHLFQCVSIHSHAIVSNGAVTGFQQYIRHSGYLGLNCFL